MKTRLFLYALGIWIILVVLAIANGALRETFIRPSAGEQAGHLISSIILICVIFIATYIFVANLKISYTKTDLILVGAYWVILTVLFEFVFGHYIMGHLWSTLLADYNILKGRLWSLVLLATFAAPILMGSIVKK